jgi:PHS family inorganic phosphate transporter-like MFS transporter
MQVSEESKDGVAAEASTNSMTSSKSFLSKSAVLRGSAIKGLDEMKLGFFHIKMVVISGMGFFTDAYDLFSISLLTKLLGRIYFQDSPFVTNSMVSPGKLPIDVDAAVSAVALCGTLFGQGLFGMLGDFLGRKTVYGLVLCIMVFCAFAQSMSFGTTPKAVIGTLCFWRFLLGIGVGGDYPLSATIMSEYSSRFSRGALVGSVFAMQGIGILVAAAVTAIVTACFDRCYPGEPFPVVIPGCHATTWSDTSCTTLNKQEYYRQVLASCPYACDFVWRTVLAFGAFPALCTLYIRTQMAESPRFTQSVQKDATAAALDVARILNVDNQQVQTLQNVVENQKPKKSEMRMQHAGAISFGVFLRKYWVVLLGSTMCWFLLDIAFYSQNLFQKDVFLQTGFLLPPKYMNALGETGKISRAQACIALGSTIPGYWATVFFVDSLGRKFIQFMGFIVMTALMAAMAGSYRQLLNPNNSTDTALSDRQPVATNGWIAMYAFCFFFANFGPNATTFIYPSEVFPTQWRSTGHGISAAFGKAGAILGAFGFLYASQPKRGETTFSYPCKPEIMVEGALVRPSDLNSDGACKVSAMCPTGTATKNGLGNTCFCNPLLLSGCYPHGIGVGGALGILAATNFLGMLFTFCMPETKGRTLEDICGEDVAGALAEIEPDTETAGEVNVHM